MRWWGWGTQGHDPVLPPAAEALLARELGPGGAAAPPVELDAVALPEQRLEGDVREQLAAIVGPGRVRDDRLARVTHAAGRSYPDLVRLRRGEAPGAPDFVVEPGTPEEVAAVLRLCARADVPVVPFGGGTSVVGGVEAGPGMVTLDLGRLDRLVAADTRSLTATLQAGMPGPAVERSLAGHDVTLGHYPQSFEYSTVGGWIATRSAGQASTGVGRIEDLVLGLRCITPEGELEVPAFPATAAGPDLRELVLGSEGMLGVVTEATLRVRPRPEARRYEGWSFRSFAEGMEALRTLEQSGVPPDVARLSDEHETRLGLAFAPRGASTRAVTAYLRARGHRRASLAIFGWEGDAAAVRARRRRAGEILRKAGGIALGPKPGAVWARGRFEAPYLRDVLLGRRVLVDTLETAASWSALPGLYAAVAGALHGALAGRGTPPLVMCHISHLYPTGASLYFTFFARQEPGGELEQWHAAKAAATDAIVAGGGTITHHHAVGRDHAPWLEAEIGRLGIEVLQAAKARVDPAGIMNPGKVLAGTPLPGAHRAIA